MEQEIIVNDFIRIGFISTMWNVNVEIGGVLNRQEKGFISTMWNVN